MLLQKKVQKHSSPVNQCYNLAQNVEIKSKVQTFRFENFVFRISKILKSRKRNTSFGCFELSFGPTFRFGHQSI